MSLLFSLMMFCISTLFSPGPNNIMIMASGLNYGIQKSTPHYLGICFGFPFMLILIGFGLSSLFNAYPIIQESIKIAGIIYMFYLAWKVATAKTHIDKPKSKARTKPLSFLQAVLFQWANPKAWVMAISAFGAFSGLSNSVTVRTITITLIFLIFGFLSAGFWLFCGVGLQKYLKKPHLFRNFNYLMGLLLVASAIMIIFE